MFKLTTLKPIHTTEKQKSVKSEGIKSHLTICEEEIQKSSSSSHLVKKPVLKSRTTLQPFHREAKLRTVKKGRKMVRKNKFPRARKVYARKQAKCDQQNLEECVDGCNKVEDILEYSGCVVQCSEVC